MLLVIDIGNTNIVIGVFEDDTLKAHWRIATKKTKTEDEYGILFVNLFRTSSLSIDDVDGIIMSSVVPPLSTTIGSVIEQYFGQVPLLVGPGVRTGMPILYDNPKEVGADRIVNSVGAYHKYKSALIIVDFGTATTFDVVSIKGEYLGGMIAPGISISINALFIHTSKLPRVELKKPKSIIGKNTIHSIQSGILYGYVGLVDGIVDKIVEEMGIKPKVIATGGLASVITPETRTIEVICENLTLDGLRLIWEMNRK